MLPARPSVALRSKGLIAALVILSSFGVFLRLSFVDVRMAEPPPRRGGWRSKVAIEAPLNKVAWLHDEQLYYLSTALNSFEGRGFFPDYNTVRDGIYVPPPGESLFLLAVFRLAGRLVEPATLLTIQSVISGLTAFLAGLLCLRLASPIAAVMATALLSTHPDYIFHSAYLMTENNYLFILVVFLSLLTKAVETSSLKVTALAAICLGFLHLQRINAAPAGIVLALAWLAYSRGRAWKHAVLLGLAPFLVLAPWLGRNLAVYNEPIWVNSNAGVHLWLANHPKLDAAATPYIEEQRDALIPQIETALHDGNGRLTVTYYEYSRIYEKKMWEYARAQPGHFARNLIIKFFNQFTKVQTGPRVAWLRWNSETIYTLIQRAVLSLGLLGLAAFLALNRSAAGSAVVIMFLVLQKYFVRALAEGATKA